MARGARKRPACIIVGVQCIDRWQQSLQDYVPTQLHSNVLRYMHSPFGGIGLPLSRTSAMLWQQLIDSDVRTIELELCKKTLGFMQCMHKNNAVLILPFAAKHEPKTTKRRTARGKHV